MSLINCQLENSNSNVPLTVGDPFYFVCQGSEFLLENPVEIRTDPADEYKLELLNYEINSANQIRIQVRSLKTGMHQLQNVQLVDSKHSLVMDTVQFQVQSILDPNQKTEPYGPMGPLKVSYPMILWIILILILAIAVIAVLTYAFKKWHFKKLIRQMNFSQYSRSPSLEFYFYSRKISRELERTDSLQNLEANLIEIKRQVLIYIGRCFNWPTLYWPDKKILKSTTKELSKSDDQIIHKLHLNQLQKDLNSFFKEMNRLNLKSIQCQSTDVQQMLNLSRKIVDNFEAYKNTRSL